jgi:hypothetical protein
VDANQGQTLSVVEPGVTGLRDEFEREDVLVLIDRKSNSEWNYSSRDGANACPYNTSCTSGYPHAVPEAGQLTVPLKELHVRRIRQGVCISAGHNGRAFKRLAIGVPESCMCFS